jgi:insulysin
MLFLGTEKYQKEGEYQEKIKKYGGSCNAYTSNTDTNYYFDVIPKHFEEILDMFASFFTSPLFTESATERELNAVKKML